MSQRDQHVPHYTTDMLEGAQRESDPEAYAAEGSESVAARRASPADAVYGSAADELTEEEDGDAVTRVHNPVPSDAPPGAAPWHLHLEVRPEQLVQLHRMGLTGGAHAWRHGMGGWQQLREGSEPPADSAGAPDGSGHGYEHEAPPSRQAPESSRRAFMFPRTTGTSTLSSVSHVSALSSSRPPPVPFEEGMEEMLGARSLPPPPRLPSGFPPPRYEDSAIHAEFHEPEAGELALVPRPAWLLRPPAALDSQHTLPPAVLDAYRGSRVVLEQRTIWFGLGATVALSAAVAALVSSLVWKLNSGNGSNLESALVASVAAARPAETRRVDPEPQSASISVDQLPLLDRRERAPAVTINPAERSERREAPPRAERTERAPEPARAPAAAPAAAVRLMESEPKAEAPREAAPPAPPSKPASELDSSIAARLAQEGGAPAPKRAERPAPVAAASPGPADREGLARAVNLAASAAQSCGTSPENGQVMVKFSPSGSAQSVQLLKPFSNHDVNACVLRAMSRARIAPFSGEAVAVRKSVRW